jgi:hypothetical protein
MSCDAAPPLVVDAAGVRRLERDGTPIEAIAWADLVAVTVVTTSEGPWTEDAFVLLAGHDGRGVAVPNGLIQGTDLIARLFRLPRFDGQAFIRAQMSTDDARFDCWSGARGEGSPAGGP